MTKNLTIELLKNIEEYEKFTKDGFEPPEFRSTFKK